MKAIVSFAVDRLLWTSEPKTYKIKKTNFDRPNIFYRSVQSVETFTYVTKNKKI